MFNMVVSAQPQLTMWHNDLNWDHRRTLNYYVGALTDLIDMDGWLELIEVLTGYWDSQRMVFRFGALKITPTLEEIRDCIDIVCTGLE